jgi:hypothetical protein
MNDLSVPRSDDPERDKRIVDLVIGGKRVDRRGQDDGLHCRRRELGWRQWCEPLVRKLT